MGLLNEYIKKKLDAIELQEELLGLISEYNKTRGTFLFVYSSSMEKNINEARLIQDDYYSIHDILSRDEIGENIDFYIETLGGSGEAAEEIVRFLHDRFKSVSFVVSGEAKSAGTLLVLSGHEILMTETGSLGPIDAQLQIGRSFISAYDYMEWIKEKREEAEKKGMLNPFDATMIAQITPGELIGVDNALRFSEDLVKEWLPKYKFANWNCTETKETPVTEEIKKNRAEEIARELINHSKWRTHGRSLKIKDLESIGLKIQRVDDDKKLSDLVYRIQTICKLLFNTTSIFKIFATKDLKLFRQAISAREIKTQKSSKKPEVANATVECPKCKTIHEFYLKFSNNPKIDSIFKKKGIRPFPIDSIVKCSCGHEIDLSGLKHELEIQMGEKAILNKGGNVKNGVKK